MKPTDWNKKVKLEFQRPHYHLVSAASLWKNVKPDKFEMKSDIFPSVWFNVRANHEMF